MDPMTMAGFFPTPGMDPFSLGIMLRQNPEALAGELAKHGPPPGEGQSFFDWLGAKLGHQPNAYGNAATPRTEPGFPMAPQPNPDGAPALPPPAAPLAPMPAAPGMGTIGLNDMGVAPQYGEPSPPTMYQRRTVPESQMGVYGGGVESPRVAGAPMDITSDAQKGQDLAGKLTGAGKALKDATSPFAGLKAPPAPAVQRISSPAVPQPRPMPGGGIAALVQALLSGQQTPAVGGLRLGNALYAGGRGLY